MGETRISAMVEVIRIHRWLDKNSGDGGKTRIKPPWRTRQEFWWNTKYLAIETQSHFPKDVNFGIQVGKDASGIPSHSTGGATKVRMQKTEGQVGMNARSGLHHGVFIIEVFTNRMQTSREGTQHHKVEKALDKGSVSNCIQYHNCFSAKEIGEEM